jgi:hypothetical protein
MEQWASPKQFAVAVGLRTKDDKIALGLIL